MASNIVTVNYGSKTYEIEAIVEDEFNNYLEQDDLSECLANIQMKAETVVRE
jgi:lactose/L-arabinose transport system substrate-binding protein